MARNKEVNKKVDKSFFGNFAEADWKRKLLAVLSIVLIFVVSILIAAYAVGSLYRIYNVLSGEYADNPIKLGFTRNLKWTLTTSLVLWLVLCYLILKSESINKAIFTDKRNVSYMENSVHGSATIALPDEINEFFNISDINDTDEIVYGQVTEGGKDVLSYKRSSKVELTRNVLVVASTGGGKSHNLIKPNFIQAIRRGHSVITVDPSGELYTELGQYSRDKGVDTKLLNLQNLDYSECWDCVGECFDPETKRISDERLSYFVTVFLRNSVESIKENLFWYECAYGMVKTVISFLAYKKEKYIIDRFVELYQKLTGMEDDDFIHKMKTTGISLVECENVITEIAVVGNKDIYSIKNVIKQIYDNSPSCTINDVYEFITYDFDENEAKFEEIKKIEYKHLAKSCYERYKILSKNESVKTSAITNTQQKLEIFDNEKLRKVLSMKGIDFTEMNKKQSAYFVGVSDTNNAYKPIASLAFSFFIKDVQESYDKEDKLSKSEHRENKCIPVMALFDEFGSLGLITGDTQEYKNFANDARKRKIYVMYILQYISLLEGIYGKYTRDAILSSCTTTLYLSGNDPETLEWISEKAGVGTVQDDNHRDMQSVIGKIALSDNINIRTAKRNLYNEDEAAKIYDKILIMKQGCNPFEAELFPFHEHPAYINGECKEVTFYDNIQKLEYRETEEKAKKLSDPDVQLFYMIKNLSAENNDIIEKTNEENKRKEENLKKEIENKLKEKEEKKEQLKNIAATQSPDLPYTKRKCPECGKKLVMKMSKEKKLFISCERWGKGCDYRDTPSEIDLKEYQRLNDLNKQTAALVDQGQEVKPKDSSETNNNFEM